METSNKYKFKVSLLLHVFSGNPIKWFIGVKSKKSKSYWFYEYLEHNCVRDEQLIILIFIVKNDIT